MPQINQAKYRELGQPMGTRLSLYLIILSFSLSTPAWHHRPSSMRHCSSVGDTDETSKSNETTQHTTKQWVQPPANSARPEIIKQKLALDLGTKRGPHAIANRPSRLEAGLMALLALRRGILSDGRPGSRPRPAARHFFLLTASRRACVVACWVACARWPDPPLPTHTITKGSPSPRVEPRGKKNKLTF